MPRRAEVANSTVNSASTGGTCGTAAVKLLGLLTVAVNTAMRDISNQNTSVTSRGREGCSLRSYICSCVSEYCRYFESLLL